MRRTDAIRYAKILLGSYRSGEANDPEVYTAAVVAVLADYPEEVVRQVCDPRNGLPSKLKWLPALSEIKEACHVLTATWADEWKRRSLRQLAEREGPLTAAELKRREEVVEAAKVELAAQGMHIGDEPSRIISSKPFKRYTDAELLEMYPPKSGVSQETSEEEPSW